MSVREQWKMACPNFGRDDSLQVEASIWCELHADGTEDAGAGHEWDDQSRCVCTVCNRFESTVSAFKIDNLDLAALKLLELPTSTVNTHGGPRVRRRFVLSKNGVKLEDFMEGGSGVDWADGHRFDEIMEERIACYERAFGETTKRGIKVSAHP